jgi:hypothetical protein
MNRELTTLGGPGIDEGGAVAVVGVAVYRTAEYPSNLGFQVTGRNCGQRVCLRACVAVQTCKTAGHMAEQQPLGLFELVGFKSYIGSAIARKLNNAVQQALSRNSANHRE